MKEPDYGTKQKPEYVLRLINRALKHGFKVSTKYGYKGEYYVFCPPIPCSGVVDMPVEPNLSYYAYSRKRLNKAIVFLKREKIKAAVREYLETNHDGAENLKIVLKELAGRGHKIL